MLASVVPSKEKKGVKIFLVLCYFLIPNYISFPFTLRVCVCIYIFLTTKRMVLLFPVRMRKRSELTGEKEREEINK